MRLKSASLMGSGSRLDGKKEIPQKSVEGAPTPSSTILMDPAASNSFAIPAMTGIGR